VDRSFNAAQYIQSEDRIHRFGMEKDVETNIEILTCPNTIDDIVTKRLVEKVNRMSDVLDDPSLNINSITYTYDDDLGTYGGIDESDMGAIVEYLGGDNNV